MAEQIFLKALPAVTQPDIRHTRTFYLNTLLDHKLVKQIAKKRKNVGKNAAEKIKSRLGNCLREWLI